MRIILNGMKREVPERSRLRGLLEEEGEPIGHVLVERNGRYVWEKDYEATELREGDRIEVIWPLFGG